MMNLEDVVQKVTHRWGGILSQDDEFETSHRLHESIYSPWTSNSPRKQKGGFGGLGRGKRTCLIRAEYLLGKLRKFWVWEVENSVKVFRVIRLFLETNH